VLELLKPRKKDQFMKIVVLSAFIDPVIRERLNTTVADAVWEKTRDVHEFLQALKGMMDAGTSRKRPAHQLSNPV